MIDAWQPTHRLFDRHGVVYDVMLEPDGSGTEQSGAKPSLFVFADGWRYRSGETFVGIAERIAGDDSMIAELAARLQGFPPHLVTG